MSGMSSVKSSSGKSRAVGGNWSCLRIISRTPRFAYGLEGGWRWLLQSATHEALTKACVPPLLLRELPACSCVRSKTHASAASVLRDWIVLITSNTEFNVCCELGVAGQGWMTLAAAP